MADQTSHQGYNLPARGERDWGQLLNENFRQLDDDTRLVVTGSGPSGNGGRLANTRELVIGSEMAPVDDPDRGDIEPGDGRAFIGLGDGYGNDPAVIGVGATANDTGTVVGPDSTAPSDGVVVGEAVDASGNDRSTIVGQSNASNGNEEIVVGYGNEGARAAVTIGANVSNGGYDESVTIGVNAEGANRNSVSIGAHVNENAPSTDDRWGGIRVAIGSRASANERSTAVGPGAGEWGAPGRHTVTLGNQTSAAANYSIAIGVPSPSVPISR